MICPEEANSPELVRSERSGSRKSILIHNYLKAVKLRRLISVEVVAYAAENKKASAFVDASENRTKFPYLRQYPHTEWSILQPYHNNVAAVL